MRENVTALQQAQQGFYWFILFMLAVMLVACLVRAVKGPRMADRIVATNMMGTMVMVMIAVMAFLLRESYLVDICLIYAMVSFLAVVMLAKVYVGTYEKRRQRQQEKKSK